MARLAGPFNTGPAAGGAGVATANQDTPIALIGEVIGVYVKYNHAPPAGTCDLILKTKGTSPNPGSVTFLTLTNGATDGWRRPMLQGCDAAGVAIAGAYYPILIADVVNIKIDQVDALDNADVWFMLK